MRPADAQKLHRSGTAVSITLGFPVGPLADCPALATQSLKHRGVLRSFENGPYPGIRRWPLGPPPTVAGVGLGQSVVNEMQR